MKFHPIVPNVVSAKALENGEIRHFENFFVPSMTPEDELGEPVIFSTNRGALYVQTEDGAHRVVDLSLSKPQKAGSENTRIVNIKYLKNEDDETEDASFVARGAEAETMVSSLARQKISTNLSVEELGKIQTPLLTNTEKVKNKRKNHKYPFKRKAVKRKSAGGRALWDDCLKPLATFAVKYAGVMGLILCVLGILAGPLAAVVVPVSLLAMMYPDKIVERAEKIVTAFPKKIGALKRTHDWAWEYASYRHNHKDFWYEKQYKTSQVKKEMKEACKGFLEETKPLYKDYKTSQRAEKIASLDAKINSLKLVQAYKPALDKLAKKKNLIVSSSRSKEGASFEM